MLDFDGSTPEPAKRLSDTDQRVPCFDSCQLIKTLMSNMCALSVFPVLFSCSVSCSVLPVMVTGYWSVHILFWQLLIDHIVNVLFHKRCGLAETRLRHPSLPFDNLPYPSHTICRRVGTYVRSVNHMTTKRKEVDHIPWVWGSVPRALRARGSPANNRRAVTSHALQKNFFPAIIHASYSPNDTL